jgi:hypothetical protein
MSSIREKEVINLVMRQTDYTEEQTKEKLKQWNNNYINVIKEYLNPHFNKKETKKPTKTLNQQMMGEIRSFMDDVYIKFENRKRYNQYVNVINQMKQNEANKKKETENNNVDKKSSSQENQIKIEEVE